MRELIASVLVALLLVGRPAAAQTTAREPLATLGTWADGVWLSLLDRDGAWAGRLSDEGIFQRFHPDETTDYRPNLHTALFSPSEDARWALRATGLRAAAGSLTRPEIAQRVEWRERFVVSAGWTVEGSLQRERTQEVARDHVRTGLFWQSDSTRSWEAGATVGLHFFKPSADIELVVRRSWAWADLGLGHLDVRVALLDTFNDLIFQGLGVRPKESDAHFDYLLLPAALRADGSWSAGSVRFEIRGGVSRRSLVRVTFPEAGDPPYELGEQVAFAGGLVELQAGPRSAVAALASVARAESERVGDTPSPTDLSLREVTHTAGLRARQILPSNFSLEADLSWTDRPETRSTGGRTAPDPGPSEHRDRELFGGIALVRRPAAGWTARLFYTALNRDADPLKPQLTDRNRRLTTEAGYRFASGFEWTAGVRWEPGDEFLFHGAQLRFTTGRP